MTRGSVGGAKGIPGHETAHDDQGPILRGGGVAWLSAEKQSAVLLDYIARQNHDAAFLGFVGQVEAHPAMTQADSFLWAVAEKLQHPGLALEARFQLFCLDTFDLFTVNDAASEWRSRSSA